MAVAEDTAATSAMFSVMVVSQGHFLLVSYERARRQSTKTPRAPHAKHHDPRRRSDDRDRHEEQHHERVRATALSTVETGEGKPPATVTVKVAAFESEFEFFEALNLAGGALAGLQAGSRRGPDDW